MTDENGTRCFEVPDNDDLYSLEADAFSAAVSGNGTGVIPLSDTLENLRVMDLILNPNI